MIEHQKTKENRTEKIKRYIIGFSILIGVYLALILFSFYPHWPKDVTGWFILILAGIPICLSLEWIGELSFNKEKGEKISNKRFSFSRILIALSIFIVIFAFFISLWLIFGASIRQHFS